MKKLTALILSAAIIPAFSLSTAATAANQDDMRAGEKQQAGEKQSKDTNQQSDSMPTTIDYIEYNVGEKKIVLQNSDNQRADKQQSNGDLPSAFYATDVIGNNVKHRDSDEDIGEIKDLIIGEDGRLVGVVVTTGGFLGLDGQDAGISWDQIEHSMEGDESVFYTEIDEETLRNSLKYVRD